MAKYGPKWPLKSGTRDTYEYYETPEDQINYYLRSLLLTNKTENISDPDYGVGIRNYLFEQSTSQSLSIAQAEIYRQIQIYLPYLTIVSVDVFFSDDDIDANKSKIQIVYTVPRNVNQIVFSLDLNSDETIGFY